jgi:hypothetical protein
MDAHAEPTAAPSAQSKPLDDAENGKDASNFWDCQLMLKVSPHPSKGQFEETDIMSLTCSGDPKVVGRKYYFDPLVYPATHQFARREGGSWERLLSDIQEAARASGFELYSGGGTPRARTLKCQRNSTYYPPRSLTAVVNIECREASLMKDGSNNHLRDGKGDETGRPTSHQLAKDAKSRLLYTAM